MVAETKRVLGVECLGKADPDQIGVISCEIVPFDELDDDTLQMLYNQSPDWVIEHRPDWVKIHYPNSIC